MTSKYIAHASGQQATSAKSTESRSRLLNRWPRAFARLLDLGWEVGLLTYLLSYAVDFHSNGMAPGSFGFYLMLLGLIPFALLLDASISSVFGNTPAKAIIGVRATSSRGERLGFGTLLRRSYGIWTDGLALGLLPFSVLTMRSQFKRVSGRREANYDERLHLRMRSGDHTGIRTAILLFVVIVLAISGPSLLAEVQSRL